MSVTMEFPNNMFINKRTNDITIQGAQESGIPEIPGILMRFPFRQGISEKPGNAMGFFIKAFQVFKLIILIFYLLDNSLGQDIKRSHVNH